VAGFTDPASLTDNPHTTQHPKIVKKKIKKKKVLEVCVSCGAHW